MLEKPAGPVPGEAKRLPVLCSLYPPPTHTHTHTHTHTPQGPHLISGFRHASYAKRTETTGFPIEPSNKPVHSFLPLTHSFLPSLTHLQVHSFVTYLPRSLILLINSNFSFANPCIHSFMLLTDSNTKSISIIKSINIHSECLLCARYCQSLR